MSMMNIVTMRVESIDSIWVLNQIVHVWETDFHFVTSFALTTNECLKVFLSVHLRLHFVR